MISQEGLSWVEPKFCHEPFLYGKEKIRGEKTNVASYITLQFVAFHFHSVPLNRTLKILTPHKVKKFKWWALQKSSAFSGTTSGKMSLRLSEIWEGTESWLMSPWPVKMDRRLKLTKLSWLRPAHSSWSYWRGTNTPTLFFTWGAWGQTIWLQLWTFSTMAKQMFAKKTWTRFSPWLGNWNWKASLETLIKDENQERRPCKTRDQNSRKKQVKDSKFNFQSQVLNKHLHWRALTMRQQFLSQMKRSVSIFKIWMNKSGQWSPEVISLQELGKDFWPPVMFVESKDQAWTCQDTLRQTISLACPMRVTSVEKCPGPEMH